MIHRLRHTAAWMLLVFHCSGIAAPEFGHAHHRPAGLPGGAAVAPHDCGTHERHVPPERIMPCAACSPGSIRIGLAPAVDPAVSLPASREGSFAIPFHVAPAASRSACADRAPPRAASS